MKQINQNTFIKKAMKGVYKNDTLLNYGEDGYTYSQGLYLKNRSGAYYGCVQISFKKQAELQQGGYISILNIANSKEFKEVAQ